MVKNGIQRVLAVAFLLAAGCGEADSRDTTEGRGDFAEGVGVTWEEPVVVATGPAFQGPWRMNDSKFLYVDDPAAAFDRDGNLALVWVDNAKQDIFFQRFDASGVPQFEEPVNVSRSGNIFSWIPRLAVDRHDPTRVYALWQEIVFSGGSHGGETFFSYSTDGGRTFSEPINLSQSLAGAGKGRLSRDHWHNGSMDMALGADGTLHVVWTEYEGPLRYRRSMDGGRSFEEQIHVCGDDRQPARGPVLATNREGMIFLAWTHGEDAAADIRLTWSTDGGASFRTPLRAAETSGHSDAPALGVDPEGRLHLIWAESADGVYGRYRLERQVWQPEPDAGLRLVDTQTLVAPTDFKGVESVNYPALASWDGRLHLVFELFPDHRARPRGLGFAAAAADGRGFGAPTVVPGTTDPSLGINGSLQGLLTRKVAAGPDGRVAVVSSHFDRGRRSVVLLIRGELR